MASSGCSRDVPALLQCTAVPNVPTSATWLKGGREWLMRPITRHMKQNARIDIYVGNTAVGSRPSIIDAPASTVSSSVRRRMYISGEGSCQPPPIAPILCVTLNAQARDCNKTGYSPPIGPLGGPARRVSQTTPISAT